MKNSQPTIAISLGDPNGVGPEIVTQALSDKTLLKQAHWKVFGKSPAQKVSAEKAGALTWQALDQALAAIKRGECDALVTAPASKTHLKKAGFKYPGHTEYLVHTFKAKQHAMMLCGGGLRVVLVTIHQPLKKVASLIKPTLVFEKIKLTHDSLCQQFKIKQPRIAVCGLNPHAGEGGLFGDEEKRLITPALTRAKRHRIKAVGPFSADTIFHRALEGEFDAVICQYHDQGLIPLKTIAFHEGVNMTLGLPIVRTSPDHGPAFDLAGTGKANPSSMKAAMRLAVELV